MSELFQQAKGIQKLGQTFEDLSSIVSIESLSFPLFPNLSHLSPYEKEISSINQFLKLVQQCLGNLPIAGDSSFKTRKIVGTLGYCINNIVMNFSQLSNKLKILFDTLISEQLSLFSNWENLKQQYSQLNQQNSHQYQQLKTMKQMYDKISCSKQVKDETIMNLKAELCNQQEVVKEMNNHIEVLEFRLSEKTKENKNLGKEVKSSSQLIRQIKNQYQHCYEALNKVISKNVEDRLELEKFEELLENREKSVRKWKDRCFQELNGNRDSTLQNHRLQSSGTISRIIFD